MAIGTRELGRIKTRKYLERQLMPLSPGDSLPPIRQLISSTGVSRARLESVLDEFVSEGMVERKPRRGIFKSTNSDNATMVPIIDLVACGRLGDMRDEGTYGAELLEALSTEAGNRHQGLRFSQFWVNASISEYESLACRSGVKACIFLSLHLPELPRIFENHNVAWVSLLPQTGHESRQTVMASPEMIDVQMKHLFELGHRRIAYIHGVAERAPSLTQLIRREGYHRMMAERGFKVEPHWVAYSQYEESEIFEALEQVFSKPPYPTAIIVRDPQLSTVYRFLERRGMEIGKDISVMGTDDLSAAGTLHPPATSVRNSRKVAAQMALEILEKVLAGEKVEDVRYVPVELVVRESTGPAPEDSGSV